MIIVFEGLDGSGKTTAASELQKHLIESGHTVEIVFWNSFVYSDKDPLSASLFSGALEFRDNRTLGPLAYSYLHAADFANRWEAIVAPALASGKIVIFDRYKFTALARDVIRGIPENTVNSMYWFAKNPDLLFYLQIRPEVAFNRKVANRTNPSYYESGCDIYRSTPDCSIDLQQSFIKFQTECAKRYAEIIVRSESCFIDAELPEDQVSDLIIQITKKKIRLERRDSLK
jgi:dTMP kinase